jgi:hypothetical protein
VLRHEVAVLRRTWPRSGGTGPPGGAGRADQAPAGRLRAHRLVTPGAVLRWHRCLVTPGHREAGLSAPHGTPQPERRVLCRAVKGVQGGSRSKRQGWTRPAGRDGAPLADVTAVRGTPCAFAPGVAGHTAPLPQAGRGEPRCRRGTVTCARSACATSPGARASMRRDRGSAAAGHHPRRPGAATRTCRTWPAPVWRRGAAETCPRHCVPGGSGLEVSWTISFVPSAEALCDAWS